MSTEKNVVPFKQVTEEEKTIFTIIPVRAEIDPKDTRNCLSASWKDREEGEAFDEFFNTGEVQNIKGRCPGMGTVLDTADLVCTYFSRADPTAFSPLSVFSDAILRAPDGKIAQWGTTSPVRRCAPCRIGERLIRLIKIKKSRTA